MKRTVCLGMGNGGLWLAAIGEPPPPKASALPAKQAVFWLRRSVPPMAHPTILHAVSEIAEAVGYEFHGAIPLAEPWDVLETLEDALKAGRLIAYLSNEVEGGGKGPTPPPQPQPQPPPKDVVVNPLIEPAKLEVLVVKRAKNPVGGNIEPVTKPKRQPVTLKTDVPFDGKGLFTRSADKVKVFTAATGGTEITFDGKDNLFDGGPLTSGVTVYVEGNKPSDAMDDVTLKLALSGGSKKTGADDTSTVTSVELFFDLCESRIDGAEPVALSAENKVFRGRYLMVRHPKRHIERAKLVLKKTKPASYTGKLELKVSGAVSLYAAEKRPAGTPPPAEASIPTPIVLENTAIPAAGQVYWVEGTAPSATPRDVTFKLGIKDGDPEGDVARLSKIDLRFAKSANQKWGYDDLDDPDGETHHISVKKNGNTVARMLVKGPITGAGMDTDVLFYEMVNTSVAEVIPPAFPPTDSYDLYVGGKDKDKDATDLRLRINGAKGPVCATLRVHVYKLKEVKATVFKIQDKASATTTLQRPDFDVEAAQDAINEWYKAAVAKIDLVDGAPSGQKTLDVTYDLNSSGRLELDPTGTSNEEKAIKDAITGTSGQKVVIVRDVAWIYYLKTAAAVDDERITLKDALSGYMQFIHVGDVFALGAGATAENVSVKSISGTTITLNAKLTKAHTTNEGLIYLLNGLSGNPIYINESAITEVQQRQVIGHEDGHSLLNWLDLQDRTNLMHYTTQQRTDTLIRYKTLNQYHAGGTEVQWDAVSRT
ncbi:MAG: hypothetical protein U0441_38360 [Polyangiaceae bacterium]